MYTSGEPPPHGQVFKHSFTLAHHRNINFWQIDDGNQLMFRIEKLWTYPSPSYRFIG